MGTAEEPPLLRMCACHSPVKGVGVLALHAFSCCSWRSNLSLDLQQEVRLVGFCLSPCVKRAQTARRFVWQFGLGGEIRRSLSGILRVFHQTIPGGTAWRHWYTSHCILHGCTYCYKPFIVSRVSLLPECCLQSLPFPAKPPQMPMHVGFRGLLMKAEQDTTCGKLIRGIPKQ